MTNQTTSPKTPKFDLEDRTTTFSKDIIDYCRKINQDSITKPIISQLVRSSTSIGANYCEADEASSRKDFINKICIAKKETKETRYWLKILFHSSATDTTEINRLLREAQELNLIFASIVRSARTNGGIGKH